MKHNHSDSAVTVHGVIAQADTPARARSAALTLGRRTRQRSPRQRKTPRMVPASSLRRRRRHPHQRSVRRPKSPAARARRGRGSRTARSATPPTPPRTPSSGQAARSGSHVISAGDCLSFPLPATVVDGIVCSAHAKPPSPHCGPPRLSLCSPLVNALLLLALCGC